MIPRITLRKAPEDPQPLGGSLGGESWQAWRALLIAAMGEKLTDEERDLQEADGSGAGAGPAGRGAGARRRQARREVPRHGDVRVLPRGTMRI